MKWRRDSVVVAKLYVVVVVGVVIVGAVGDVVVVGVVVVFVSSGFPENILISRTSN